MMMTYVLYIVILLIYIYTYILLLLFDSQVQLINQFGQIGICSGSEESIRNFSTSRNFRVADTDVVVADEFAS